MNSDPSEIASRCFRKRGGFFGRRRSLSIAYGDGVRSKKEVLAGAAVRWPEHVILAGASFACVIRRKELTSWNLLIADLPLAPVVLVSLVSLLPFEVHDVVALTSLRSLVGYARRLCRANAQRAFSILRQLASSFDGSIAIETPRVGRARH